MKLVEERKVNIYSIGEIHIPSGFIPFEQSKNSTVKNQIKNILYSGVNTILDRSTRFYSLNWIKARLKAVKNFGVQGELSKKMFFGQGKEAKVLNRTEIQQSIKALISCQHYCDSLGIKLIILPTPNKETVYYDLIPFKIQPNYFHKLSFLASKNNILMINSLAIFNSFRKNNDQLIVDN